MTGRAEGLGPFAEPVVPARAGAGREAAARAKAGRATPFAELFAQELLEGAAAAAGAAARSLAFSAHASQRMRRTGFAPSPAEVAQLSAAVERVAARGGRQCLAVAPGAVYLVDVSTRTVVTVVTPGRMGEGVFTGIDSAVFTDAAGPVRQAGAVSPTQAAGAIAPVVARAPGAGVRGFETIDMSDKKEAVAP